MPSKPASSPARRNASASPRGGTARSASGGARTPPCSLAFGNPASHDTDLLVLGVPDGAFEGGKLGFAPLHDLDRSVGGLLSRCAAEEEFKGRDGQQLSFHTHGKAGPGRVVLLGLGKPKPRDGALDGLRVFAARAIRAARAAGVGRAALAWPQAVAGEPALEAQLEALAEGVGLGAYRYDRFQKEKRPLKLQTLELLLDKSAAKGAAQLTRAAGLGAQLAQATCLARDLVNEPAALLTPSALAEHAQRVGREHGLSVEVLGPAQIEKLGMRLFLGVSQGSHEEPRLVRMRYQPRGGGARPAKGAKGSAAAPVALVGKAITFDSGGLSLKTAQGMEDMKVDMAGAAAVIAAMQLVAQLAPPFPVVALFGACENMPSGTAQRPGDVVVGRNGTSVEILNTDAEGRLVLADVLSWACEEQPAAVVDLATLTGAIMVALGPWISGLFSNDDGLAAELLSAASAAGEPTWRMPLPPEMEELIKSPIADIKNTGGRYGGSIAAALFLQRFVGKTKWAHLDIAGPASVDKERGYNPRGGTGAGVRLLAHWIRRRAQE